MARRGFLIAASSSVVAIALGASLAGAQGEAPHIPGINTRAHAHDRGDVPDAKTIRALRRHNATTTTATTTTTTTPGATGPTGVTSTTAHPVVPPPSALDGEVLALGDSVM